MDLLFIAYLSPKKIQIVQIRLIYYCSLLLNNLQQENFPLKFQTFKMVYSIVRQSYFQTNWSQTWINSFFAPNFHSLSTKGYKCDWHEWPTKRPCAFFHPSFYCGRSSTIGHFEKPVIFWRKNNTQLAGRNARAALASTKQNKRWFTSGCGEAKKARVWINQNANK